MKITQEHIDIIKGLSWRTDNTAYGFPEIDGKRPFGNGDWENDILNIIGEHPTEMAGGEVMYTRVQEEKATQLAKELPEVIKQLAMEYEFSR